MALTRLRKMAAFDRYLTRLVKDQPGRWVLKGGLALQLWLGAASRTTNIPCYPLTQQIAEKLHAYTRQHASGESSRVKDFVDMILMAALADIRADKLRQALIATFSQRGTHPLPDQLPPPPRNWEATYKKLAGESGIEYVTIGDAFLALQEFLDPVLARHPVERWNPTKWAWHV
jgi:hypothetical protein